MKILISLIYFFGFSLCLSAQESVIKSFVIEKSTVKIAYFGSSNKKKFKLHCTKKSKCFFEDSSTRFYIDPFANTQNDTLIKTKILEVTKQYYNFKKSNQRQIKGNVIERAGMLMVIYTLGNISNFGISYGANVKGFDEEVLEAMHEVRSQVKLPTYVEDGIAHPYIYTFIITMLELRDP